MRRKKGVKRVSPKADQDFPRFLKRVRKEEKVSLLRLSEGLMTASKPACPDREGGALGLQKYERPPAGKTGNIQ